MVMPILPQPPLSPDDVTLSPLEKNRARARAYRASHLEACRARNRAYAKAHRHKQSALNREYRAKNREALRLKQREHRQKNRARIRATERRWRQLHYEETLAANRAWRAAHAEAVRAANKAWRARNPDRVRIYSERHRARKKSSPTNDLTAAQWREIKAAYGHRCVYCGRKMRHLSQDHITPLSKGGSHTARNIVPACLVCNSRKNNGPPLKPVQPLLLTLARSQTS